jgi:hypothetical protein
MTAHQANNLICRIAGIAGSGGSRGAADRGDGSRRLRAAQVLAVQRVLARTNWQKIAGGRTARDARPEAVADADLAFAQLRSGTTT